jgi:hypothetical protein
MTATSFMVVGTPRSGTTLIQRLACELPGVRMPHETHFFSLFAPGLVRRHRFPLTGDALRSELDAWRRNKGLGGEGIDIEPIFEALEGRAESMWEMFTAIVQTQAGSGSVYGEKTPTHLMWYRPLAEAIPELRFVAVVRDPRAVVSSSGRVPFGMRGRVLPAERWRADQHLVRQAAGRLGPDRVLSLRYEEVVARPDEARRQLASFLGVDGDGRQDPGTGSLYLPFETWKSRASGPVTEERTDAWRRELKPDVAETVAAICRPEMLRWGYGGDVPGSARTARRLAAIPPSMQWRRLRFRIGRQVKLAQISSPRVRRALTGDDHRQEIQRVPA